MIDIILEDTFRDKIILILINLVLIKFKFIAYIHFIYIKEKNIIYKVLSLIMLIFEKYDHIVHLRIIQVIYGSKDHINAYNLFFIKFF